MGNILECGIIESSNYTVEKIIKEKEDQYVFDCGSRRRTIINKELLDINNRINSIESQIRKKNLSYKILEDKIWELHNLKNKKKLIISVTKIKFTNETFKNKIKLGNYKGIRYWDVSKVTDMSYLFPRPRHFDVDISLWNVSRVKNMRMMFNNAKNFDRNMIKDWNISNSTITDNIFG